MKIALLAFTFFFAAGACSFGAVQPGDDFNANTRSAVSALQEWYNASGLWDTTGWWNAANCVEAVENDIAANNDLEYLATLQNTFTLNSGGGFLNDYYDDDGWWANAWIRAYDLTGNADYLNMAKNIFAGMKNGWDSHCNGGLWWSQYQTYKNAIPNELFMLVAIRLHQRTPGDGGPGGYFYWATNEWAWFQASGMINGQNLVNDGLTGDCLNNGQTTWTYNQGVIVGALTELYKSTGDTNYLARAEAIADAALAHLTSAAGVLQEPCETGGGCGGGDVPEFKGIFVRNLATLYDVDRKPAYFNFLFANAHSVWFNDRNSASQLGLKWTGPFDSADAARQSSAIMAISALAAPTTPLLPFAKGAGDPAAFNHFVGVATGAVAWACSPAIAGHPGLMQYGPYLASLPTGSHTAHFRISVATVSNAATTLVSCSVAESGAVIANRNVNWTDFARAGEAEEFSLPFTNKLSGGLLEFRVFWNNASGAPLLTLSDTTVDGARNWLAANLDHDIGRLDGFNHWEADPVRDTASGFLVRGPGATELPPGNYKAQFELSVDNFNGDNATVATVSVVNAETETVVASRDVARSEFPNTRFHTFGIVFQAVTGARYDFRTYWHYATNAPRLTQRSVVVAAATGRAFLPVALTSGSFSQDMVIEHTAPHPPSGNTTASMDSGVANTANGWYEQGYNAAAPGTGLPPGGSTFTNQSSSDHIYSMASGYTAGNAAMVDASHSANLIPVAPQPFSALSFLSAAGHGPVTVDYRVEHADATAETGSFVSPDWFFNAPVAFNANGRADVSSGLFNNVNNRNPRLYSADIALTNWNSPVTNIALMWNADSHSGSVAAVFAVSGLAIEPVPLSYTTSGGRLVLTWPGGVLLETTNLGGPWIANPNARTPYTVTPGGSSRFFRIQAQ